MNITTLEKMDSITGQCSKKQRSPTRSGMTMRVGDGRLRRPWLHSVIFANYFANTTLILHTIAAGRCPSQ